MKRRKLFFAALLGFLFLPVAVILASEVVLFTGEASDITDGSAILNGFVSDMGDNDQAMFWFEWGPTSQYGNSSLEETISGPCAQYENTIGLQPGKDYHYRAVVETDNGIFYGQDQVFTTISESSDYLAMAQEDSGYLRVESLPASEVSAIDAILNGSVLELGPDENLVWFEWGTDPINYNFSTLRAPMNDEGFFNEHVFGLLPGTEYHYRAVGQDSAGNIIYGRDVEFFTAGIDFGGTFEAGEDMFLPPDQAAYFVGPTEIDTGISNNIFTDYFIIPLFILILLIYLYFSGSIAGFADYLKTRFKNRLFAS